MKEYRQSPLKPVLDGKLDRMRETTEAVTYDNVSKPVKNIICSEFSDEFILKVAKEEPFAKLYINTDKNEYALVVYSADTLNAEFNFTKHIYKSIEDMINTIIVNMNYNYIDIFNYFCTNTNKKSNNSLFKSVDELKGAVDFYAKNNKYMFFVPDQLGFEEIHVSSLIKTGGYLL